MCGRFTLLTDEECADIEEIVREVEKAHGPLKSTGDIYPTNASPVLINRNGRRAAELFTWGFPNFYRKGVVINARAETAPEKPMFRSCLPGRRCVIPSAGFYEWDKEKRKYLFRQPGHGLYMVGLYALYDNEPRFVILTTAANSTMSAVHDRMPVVLKPDRIDGWLTDSGDALRILRETPPLLDKCPA